MHGFEEPDADSHAVECAHESDGCGGESSVVRGGNDEKGVHFLSDQ